MEVGTLVAYIDAKKQIAFGKITKINEFPNNRDRYKIRYVIDDNIHRYPYEIKVVPKN